MFNDRPCLIGNWDLWNMKDQVKSYNLWNSCYTNRSLKIEKNQNNPFDDYQDMHKHVLKTMKNVRDSIQLKH